MQPATTLARPALGRAPNDLRNLYYLQEPIAIVSRSLALSRSHTLQSSFQLQRRLMDLLDPTSSEGRADTYTYDS